MTYMKIFSGLVLGAAILAAPGAFADTIAVFNTGVNDSGHALAAGTADTHYNLVAPTGLGYVATAVTANGAWIADSSTASWISPGGTSGNDVWPSTAPYDYQTTFDLTGYTAASASMTISWTSDNDSILKLNGVTVPVGVGFPGYSPGTIVTYTVAGGLNAGVNTLDFIINNGYAQGYTYPNPTGLLVTDFSVSANQIQPSASPVPEPSSLMLLGTGLFGACGIMRRRTVRS